MLLLSRLIAGADAAGTPGPEFFVEDENAKHLSLECQLAYGSGGTTTDVYVQTSFDGGATWGDIANFNFTTASAKKRINLSALTPVTTQNVPASGALASNTAIDGIIGGKIRVLTKSSGTYAGTTVSVYSQGSRLRKT